jgi:hypothetical protein
MCIGEDQVKKAVAQ